MKAEMIGCHGLQCIVYIHDTQREMLAYIEMKYGERNPNGGGYTRCGDGQCYSVHFAKDVLYLCTVTHEFAHVAQHHAAFIGADGMGAETMPTIIESLTRIFWNRMMGLEDNYYILANMPLLTKDFMAVSGRGKREE